MKEATKRAASEALAQMLAVTAMLVIASVVFYVRWPHHRHCEPTGRREAPPDDRLREAIHLSARGAMDCFVASLLAM